MKFGIGQNWIARRLVTPSIMVGLRVTEKVLKWKLDIMLPWKPPEIASDRGLIQYGRGIGYSFQLAITAPLYSIISYCIATAQS